MEQWVVTLESELYGIEEFFYDTEEEAWAGARRLRDKVLEYEPGDIIIERKVTCPMPYTPDEDDGADGILDDFDWEE